MAELRRGNFTSAMQWAERVLNAVSPNSGREPGTTGESAWVKNSLACRVNALFVRALALAQMGKIEAARASLSEGEQTIQVIDKEFIWVNWLAVDWLVDDLLRREARKLIQ